MNHCRYRIALLLSVLGAVFLATDGVMAQPTVGLGTLLFSPAERRAISQSRTAPIAADQLVYVPEVTKVNGLVLVAKGRDTAWINGEPVPVDKVSVARVQGTAVMVGGHRLQVGESVNTVTGERFDVTQPGAVRKGRAP